MARAVWHARRAIYAEASVRGLAADEPGEAARSAAAQLPVVVSAFRGAACVSDLAGAAEAVRAVLSWHNHAVRLAVRVAAGWPRAELQARARACASGCCGCGVCGGDGPLAVLPPPTPCEFVEDSLAWWAFGLHDRADAWLGHGYFWRGMPPPDGAAEGQEPCLENAAGNAMHDFDVLEDRFCRLRRASVLCADYALLRRHFPELRGEEEAGIDRWLLENAAWLSQGQVLGAALGVIWRRLPKRFFRSLDGPTS